MDFQWLKRKGMGIGVVSLLLPVVYLAFLYPYLSSQAVIGVGVVLFCFLLRLSNRQTNTDDKKRIDIFLTLAISAIVFWMIYYTGPMGVMIFLKNNVDKQIYGYTFATQWLLTINSAVIIIGAPIIATLLNGLRRCGLNFSIHMQFMTGMLLLSLSFFVLAIGIRFSSQEGYSSIYFIMLHFVSQSLGELFIAPVGYAMVGRLAPKNLQGLLMGCWMMFSGVAASLSHYFSNGMTNTLTSNPLLSNQDYLNVFNQLGLCALIGACVLYAFSRKTNTATNELLTA